MELTIKYFFFVEMAFAQKVKFLRVHGKQPMGHNIFSSCNTYWTVEFLL